MSNQIIIIRERVWPSLMTDAVTFVMLAALPWFNYQFCGGSWWINAAIAIAWFVNLFARGSGQLAKWTKTPAQARAWLNEHYPETRDAA